MKALSVKEIKTELNQRSQSELVELCLHLSKFKKENKELLTYLLFESDHEEGYIQSVKEEIDLLFEEINTQSYYFIKKSIRKTLRRLKTYIRYSKQKETEVELLLYFCTKLKHFSPSIKKSTILKNLYHRELLAVQKKVTKLHEDLQYDYQLEIQQLTSL